MAREWRERDARESAVAAARTHAHRMRIESTLEVLLCTPPAPRLTCGAAVRRRRHVILHVFLSHFFCFFRD